MHFLRKIRKFYIMTKLSLNLEMNNTQISSFMSFHLSILLSCAINWLKEICQFLNRTSHILDLFNCLFMVSFDLPLYLVNWKLDLKSWQDYFLGALSFISYHIKNHITSCFWEDWLLVSAQPLYCKVACFLVW